jgi:hypothetical protein
MWRKRDLFPSLDDPWVEAAGRVDFLAETDEVVGIVVGEAARAYPVPLVAYHHAVNDRIGDTRLVVGYCELCSSATAFRSTLGAQALHFQFEGVYQGTLVMRDRETGSLWLHLTGECVSGRHRGATLEAIPHLRVTTWGEWHRSHPESEAVRPEPKYRALYSDARRRTAGEDFLPDYIAATLGDPDARLDQAALVFGVALADERRAYPLAALAAAGGVVEESIGGVPVAIWFDEVTKAAVGFDRRLGDQVLSFERVGPGSFRDRESGTLWNLDGVGVEGPRRGERLRPLYGIRAEWYGWTAHHPGSGLYGAGLTGS